jgi:hypothetical protein
MKMADTKEGKKKLKPGQRKRQDDTITKGWRASVAAADTETYRKLASLIRMCRVFSGKVASAACQCDLLGAKLHVDKDGTVSTSHDFELAYQYRALLGGTNGDRDKTALYSLSNYWKRLVAQVKKECGMSLSVGTWDEIRNDIYRILETKDPTLKVRRDSLVIGAGRDIPELRNFPLPFKAYADSSSQVRFIKEMKTIRKNEVECLFIDVYAEPGKAYRLVVQGPYVKESVVEDPDTGEKKIKPVEKFIEADSGSIYTFDKIHSGEWPSCSLRINMDKRGRLKVSVSHRRPPPRRTKLVATRRYAIMATTYKSIDDGQLYGIHGMVDPKHSTEKIDRHRRRSEPVLDIIHRIRVKDDQVERAKRRLSAARGSGIRGRALKKVEQCLNSASVHRENVMTDFCRRVALHQVRKALAWSCGCVESYLPRNASLAGVLGSFCWDKLDKFIEEKCAEAKIKYVRPLASLNADDDDGSKAMESFLNKMSEIVRTSMIKSDEDRIRARKKKNERKDQQRQERELLKSVRKETKPKPKGKEGKCPKRKKVE